MNIELRTQLLSGANMPFGRFAAIDGTEGTTVVATSWKSAHYICERAL